MVRVPETWFTGFGEVGFWQLEQGFSSYYFAKFLAYLMIFQNRSMLKALQSAKHDKSSHRYAKNWVKKEENMY